MLYRLLYSLLVVAALALVSIVALDQLLLSQQAQVSPPAAATPHAADKARRLLKRLAQQAKQGKPFDAVINADELSALPILLARAYPQLATQLDHPPGALILTASLQLPSPLSDRYLSAQLQIPTGTRLRLERFEMGVVSLEGALLNTLFRRLTSWLLGEAQATQLLMGSQLISSDQQGITLRLTPGKDPKQRAAGLLKRLRTVLGAATPDSLLIDNYYQKLHTISSETLSPKHWVSLTHFIAPLLRQIAEQPPTEQVEHGRAALLALALYFGGDDLAALIDVPRSKTRSTLPPHQRTLLRGRIDLRQHFIYSAAFQVLAEEDISHAIGELKELMDAKPGGSGFSFADIAADRAGTLFSSQLTRSESSASRMLRRLDKPLREGDLMIPITKLPEGVNEALFETAYRDTASHAYQQLVSEIDQRLKQLRLYRDDPLDE